MAHVYRGGVALDGAEKSKRAQTEFCLGHPMGPCHDPVRRVFLCGALESALDGHFGCEKAPSTSYEAPHWPQSDLPPTGPPPIPCNVTGCGHELGTISTQLPDGTVPQAPYISGCPGCGVDKNLGRLSGVLTWTTVPSQITSAIVTSYNLFDQVIATSSSMTPWNPTANFSLNYMPPADTFYLVLQVSFMENNVQQTDYQTVLP
jgi:hypothetical protein